MQRETCPCSHGSAIAESSTVGAMCTSNERDFESRANGTDYVEASAVKTFPGLSGSFPLQKYPVLQDSVEISDASRWLEEGILDVTPDTHAESATDGQECPCPPKLQERTNRHKGRMPSLGSSVLMKLTVLTPTSKSWCLSRSLDDGNDSSQADTRRSPARTSETSSKPHSLARAMRAITHSWNSAFGRPSQSHSEITLGRRITSMNMNIPRHLLRAVSLKSVLRGVGAELGANSGTETLYGMSKQVDRIDDFISHDWQTGRWPKVLTLCLMYNAAAAYGTCLLIGLASCILQLDSVAVLPKLPGLHALRHKPMVGGLEYEGVAGHWSIVACSVAFVFTLFFWQQMRALRPSRRVFVDKFCISQTNEKAKTEGILNLAGFLLHSKRLVVLWSPRYFTRLWCAYEMATWIYLDGLHADKMDHVKVAPVALGMITAMYWLAMLVSCASFYVETRPWMYSLIFFIAALIPVHFSRRYARELHLMEKQLSCFQIRESQCFCCTHNHFVKTGDGGEGKTLRCDRKLVYKTLGKWFHQPPPAPLEGNFSTPSESLPVQRQKGYTPSPGSSSIWKSPASSRWQFPAYLGFDGFTWDGASEAGALDAQSNTFGNEQSMGEAASDPTDEDLSYLDSFDEIMREKLRPIILKVMSSYTGMSYRSALLCTSPVLAAAFDEAAGWGNLPAQSLFVLVASRILTVFFLAPCGAKLLLSCSMACDRCFGDLAWASADLSLTAGISVVFSAFCSIGTYAVSTSRQRFEQAEFAALILCLVVLFTLFLASDHFAYRRRYNSLFATP